MRKFTSLLVLLLMTILGAGSAMADNITALTDAEQDAYYTIACGRGNLTVNAALTALVGNRQDGVNTTFDAEDPAFQFKFVENEGNYYLYNVKADKYSNEDGELVAFESAKPISFRNWGDGTVQPYWNDSKNLNLGGSNQIAIGTWKQKDAGDQFYITKLELADYIVVVEGGVEGGVAYRGENYANGTTFTAATSNTANFAPINVEGYEGKVKVDGTTVTVTYKLPAVTITTAAEVNPNKAYIIYTTARGGLTVDNADVTALNSTNDAQQNVDEDNVLQHFAFVTVDDNLYLYSVGANKFVNAAKKGALAVRPVDPIQFAQSGGGTVRLLFNAQYNINLGGAKQLAIDTWETKDDGNSFIIKEVADFDPATALAIIPHFTTYTYNYMLDEQLLKSVTVDVADGEEAPAPAADFVTIKNSTLSGTTYTVECEENLPFVVTTDETAPVWGLLRIHSNQNRYAYVNEEGKGCNSGNNTHIDEYTDGYRWYITGNLIEGFKLHNAGFDGTLEATETQATMTAEGTAWELRKTEGYGEHGFALYKEGRNYLNANTGLNYWTAADAGSSMIFDELIEGQEVTITEAGYATYYYGDDAFVAFPQVTAYGIVYDGQYLQATRSEAMDGAMGYLLQGQAGTYPLVKSYSTNAADSELMGTAEDMPAEAVASYGTVYTFAIEDGAVGFYKFAGETLAAHKAFYIGEYGDPEAYSVRFDGTEGIQTIMPAMKSSNAIFDLQGRRANAAQKGIFIQNGKKVIR